MKVCFVNLTYSLTPEKEHPRHILPPLDIGYCASLLDKNGHVTDFIETATKKDLLGYVINYLKKEGADIVVLKPSIHTLDFTLRLAKKIRKLTKHIFVIGPLASLNPALFLFKGSSIDACVINEAESTLLEVINTLQSNKSIKKVKGIAYFRNGIVRTQSRENIKNLGALPFPKHSFFINKGYTFYYPVNIKKRMNVGYMLSSRGCPYKCLFCSPIERASYGKEYRCRSAKNIADEMQLLESKGINTVYFLDDSFAVNKKIVEELCDEVIRRKLRLRWVVQARADTLDEKILMKMKQAGCSTICLGIESGSERILKMLKKDIATKDVVRTVRLIKKAGIWIVGFFIIGNPTETKEEMKETFRFAKKLLPDMIQLHFFTPYPGSAAFKKFKLDDIRSFKFNQTKQFSKISVEELKQFQKHFYIKYCLNPRFIVKYLFKRMPYLVANWKTETTLVREALHFFT